MRLEVPPLGLYIHLPWCVRKCPYCDFNSHPKAEVLPEQSYVAALLRDLEQELEQVDGRRIESLFFGGGTPSLFSPDAIHRLIEGFRQRISCAGDLEVTLEANPGAVEQGRFEGFKQAGVNRLSIGIQSFHSGHLKTLGRIHSAGEAVAAAEAAHRAGIQNFNLDLMYGLPDQSLADAIEDLRRAIVLNPAHISYYQLTIEPHTLFSKYPPVLPCEETIWAIQSEGQSMLAAQGYAQYEISAYARTGARCRHNLNYWNFGDYLGIGAGAHGKVTIAAQNTLFRSWKIAHPREYMESAATTGNIGQRVEIRGRDRILEFLMNGLRLNSGFEKTAFIARTGLQLFELEPMLSECIQEALLVESETHIRCTERGRNFLDTILTRFVPEEMEILARD